MTLSVDYKESLGVDEDQRKLHWRLKQAIIMMVDDQPEVMARVEGVVSDNGYRHFITVTEFAEAVAAIKREEPDILLLDLNLPNDEAFHILGSIRADAEIKLLPVIVLDLSANSDNKIKALQLGATEFLAKPIDPSELILRLRHCLTLKAYRDQLAYYDTLTRLPNRKLFIERVERAIQQIQQQSLLQSQQRSPEPSPAQSSALQQTVAVMSIAVDRFKQINHNFGLSVGDVLLQQIATRLINTLRRHNKALNIVNSALIRNIARSGGDEFSVLLTGNVELAIVKSIASELLVNLRKPFDIDGNEIFVTASIGVALYPNDGTETDRLVRHADAACAYAKRFGRDQYKFYSSSINAMSHQRMGLETALRRALEREELALYYQPKIAVATGKMMGMEALLRWHRLDGSLVPADKFIPIAEDTGLIVPIGQWVLHEACRQNVLWQQQGLDGLKVSVNVSGHQFRKAGFATTIENTLTTTGMPAQLLMVELTETMLTGDIKRHIRILEAIKAMGASLSIDDFGTGYSSLSYLNRFPIDELKIDRSFIIDVPENPDDSAIVKAIVAMAPSLQLSVVAEGVESDQQLQFLRGLGCDIIQGHFYSCPLPAAQFFPFAEQLQRGELSI